MPILGIPVVSQPVVLPDLFKESRRLRFRALNGSDPMPFTGNEFFIQRGAQGLEVPDRDVVEGTVPGVDGSFIDDVTIGSRKVILPIFIGTKSGHAAHLEQRSYLRNALNYRSIDLQTNDGSFDLVATSTVGERSLRCLSMSGMGGDWVADTSGTWWQKYVLEILAVRTYWYGAERWETPVIRQQTNSPWFGHFPPRLASSRAFGAGIPVLVEGDVESWPRVDVIGPCDSLLVEAPGLHISIPDGLADGERASIDTDPRARRNGTAATFGGIQDWTRIAPDDVWAPLAPGAQVFDLVLTGATSTTQAVVSGDTRWETPW